MILVHSLTTTIKDVRAADEKMFKHDCEFSTDNDSPKTNVVRKYYISAHFGRETSFLREVSRLKFKVQPRREDGGVN